LGGTAADAVNKTKADTWINPEGGYVHALHKHEWGDFHYLIKGKNTNGELILEGGWQNNRKMGMHERYRFVENIFEELDTVNEWFYNRETKYLYLFPPQSIDLKTALIKTPQINHLFEFRGSEKLPVSNLTIEGLELTQTLRTFMENKEPLLRSDWTIYRGGAIFMEGAENCQIKNCTISSVGGNAIFFSNYNCNCEVTGCLISNAGANGVCFVGDPLFINPESGDFRVKEGSPALLVGITGSAMSLGFEQGLHVAESAEKAGVDPLFTTMPVMLLLLSGTLVTTIIWCIYLGLRNRSLEDYSKSTSAKTLSLNYLFALSASFLWFIQFILYGMGKSKMGPYTFTSWGILMGLTIVFATVWGLYRKEWKGAPLKVYILMIISLIIIISSSYIIGISGSI
jgi:hypothetical protein